MKIRRMKRRLQAMNATHGRSWVPLGYYRRRAHYVASGLVGSIEGFRFITSPRR